MSLYCLDANSFITPWETNYPIDVFPTLWKHINKNKEKIIILRNIYDQIDPSSNIKTKEELNEKHKLRAWLEENEIPFLKVPKEIDFLSLRLEEKYQTKSN
ncbi:MAG: DUF4411 family protein [Bdellovibrionales bacterium]|nr:DUF4411 family protein [Bdellovibrionales bacterium]